MPYYGVKKTIEINLNRTSAENTGFVAIYLVLRYV